MQPLALQTGFLGLNAFGLLQCTALLAGALWTRASARRSGSSPGDAFQAYVMACLGALVLAHVGYGLGNLAGSDARPALLGGLHGSAGLLGALAAARLHFRGRPLGWRRWLDAQAPLLGLALSLGQLGSYLLGTDYGTRLPLSAPRWLERLGSYPRWTSSATIEALGAGAPAWVNQVGQHLLDADSRHSLPLHPTQLYLAVAGLALSAFAARSGARRRFAGEGMLLTLLAYASLMVLLEPLRDDPRRGTLPLTAPAVTWLALGVGGVLAAIIQGPLALRLNVRRRRVGSFAVLGLALVSALLLAQITANEARPLALAPLFALALACNAALAWQPWSKLATRATDAHRGVTSGPHVPTSSAPGGPLQ
jgi:phosphatidylglycerol---prolipoprotein diacylglyceryl transferase